MNALDVYFVLKLDALIHVVNGIAITIIFATAAAWIIVMSSIENNCDVSDAFWKAKKFLVWWSPISAVLFFLCIVSSLMIPTTKEAVAIIVLPKIINSAIKSGELEKLPKEIVAVAYGWTRELSPDSIKCNIKSILDHAKTINNN